MKHEALLNQAQADVLAVLYGPGVIRTQADLQRLIGERMRAARLLNGLDGKVLADIVGHKNGAQVSLWESGDRMPPAMMLMLIAATCKVPLDYLLGLSDEPERNVSAAARTQIARLVQAKVEAAVSAVVDTVYTEMTNGLPVRDGWQRTLSAILGVLSALTRAIEIDPEGFEDLRGGTRLVAAASALYEAVTQLDHRAGVTEAVRADLKDAARGICKNSQKA